MQLPQHLFDEPVFIPGVGPVTLGSAIRKNKDAPRDPYLAWYWDGAPPSIGMSSILTMADINELAATAEYARWEAANRNTKASGGGRAPGERRGRAAA
jgi:hypothetical protein